MFAHISEELLWATMQEHEAEARGMAARATQRPRRGSLRGAVARKLVRAGLRLDGNAREVALKPANGSC